MPGDALLLLSLLWALTGDSQRVEMPRSDMEVVRGQMVLLEAWYSPTSNIERNTVIWNYMANDSKQIISYSSGQIGMGSPEFRKRVAFALSMPSTNVSVLINNTQESDSGRYLCNVIIPGAPGLSGELHLNVKVPPSVPMCRITGLPVVQGNVTLSCKSKFGKPAPQYKWTKSAPASEVFFSPMQNEHLGTLQLSNLTHGMSGKYVCRASNTAGSESCYIDLEVLSPTNAGIVAGAATGSLMGLMAIILFLVFFLRKRRDTEEDMSNEIKEDAQAPKRVSWARSGTGSDVVSKNGTISSFPHNHYSHPLGSNAGFMLTTGYQPQLCDPGLLQGLPGYTVTTGCRPTLQPRTPCTQLQAQPQLCVLPCVDGTKAMVPAHNQAGSLV